MPVQDPQMSRKRRRLVREPANNGLTLPTPVKAKVFLVWLEGYDEDEKMFIVLGFSIGFHLGVEEFHIAIICANQSSADDNPEAVEKYMTEEMKANRLAGPFQFPPFENMVFSPLGMRRKANGIDWRAIQNLSFPYGDSVNSHIPQHAKTVRYPTIQDAIDFIVELGPGCFFAKTDIKKAFRMAPVRPEDYRFLGIHWLNCYYHDKVLPMGSATSCQIFQRIANALVWIARHKLHIRHIIQYIDDAFLAAKNYHLCSSFLRLFVDMCTHIGFPIAEEKTMLPTTRGVFLGIELDSVEMCARLPEEKLQKSRELVRELAKQKSVTLKQLQSAIGKLNFACSVVTPGRAFLRRLIDLTIGKSAPGCWISLNAGVREDLRMWSWFLEDYNGVSMFRNKTFFDNHHLNFFTDAASTIGFGAVFGPKWFFGDWPQIIKEERSIAWMELYPITLAMVFWGHLFKNQSILFHSDNEVVVKIINKQSTREPFMMGLVRLLVLASMKFNVQFKAVHLSGVSNIMCDLLSRRQVNEFKKRAIQIGWKLEQVPYQIPESLLPSHISYLNATEFWRNT